MWIQTGVTVRKGLNWVLTSVTLTFDLWPWPLAWTSLLSMVITPENFMIRWQEHSKKVWQVDTGRQTDGRTERSVLWAAWSQLKCFWYSSQWWAMDLLTSPNITWQSRNTFINIYSIITNNYNFLSMTALGHHYSVYYRKILVRLWCMHNRTLKTNVEPHWPLKSNLELRWPPFVCHVIWAVFETRNARTFVPSEDSESFVRRTSRMKKWAYERILTFGTAQSNMPIDTRRIGI